MERCVFCGGCAQGNYSVHTTPTMTGPEVPLCDNCGEDEVPLLGHIWHAIENNYRVCMHTLHTHEIVIVCAVCDSVCMLLNTTTRTFWKCLTCGRSIVIGHFEEMARGMRDGSMASVYRARMQRPNARWAF